MASDGKIDKVVIYNTSTWQIIAELVHPTMVFSLAFSLQGLEFLGQRIWKNQRLDFAACGHMGVGQRAVPFRLGA